MPKYSTLSIAEIVEDEGLDYSICHLIKHDEIIDKELSDLWKMADVALRKINAIVDKALEERDDKGEDND